MFEGYGFEIFMVLSKFYAFRMFNPLLLSVFTIKKRVKNGKTSNQSFNQFTNFLFCVAPLWRLKLNMETYRSGHNETDSKSVVPSRVPWVRIPPSPPPALEENSQGLFLFCYSFSILVWTYMFPITLPVSVCAQ